MKIITYGHHGWIGQYINSCITDTTIIAGTARIDNYEQVRQEIEAANVTHVILATGRRHDKVVSDIDYLELPGKIDDNIRDNLYGPAIIALICYELDIHLTYISDGAIYDSTERNRVWAEKDKPNGCNSSFYQCIKYTDQIMTKYSNVLVLRLSFPVLSDINDPRNNYKKLLDYNVVLNNQMSITVLPCFKDVINVLIKNEVVGVFNMVNSGTISQFQLRNLATDITNTKARTVSNIELANYVVSDRPSPILSNQKLMDLLDIDIPDVKTACKLLLAGNLAPIEIPETETDQELDTVVESTLLEEEVPSIKQHIVLKPKQKTMELSMKPVPPESPKQSNARISIMINNAFKKKLKHVDV